MKYGRIIAYVNDTPWALTESKLQAVVSFLVDRVNGIKATAEELEAFAGGQAPSASRQGAVAVLPLRGVIAHRAGMLDESSGGVSTESFGRMYRQAMTDPNIGSLVIDVDSPGGAVAGLHELAAEMLALKGSKRVVAVANGSMCSAAYWLAASAADEIVAIPSASVGSVGVASVYVDDSKQREANGVEVTIFASSANKSDVLGLGPLSEDSKARRQARVDEAAGWFRADVAKGRGISVAEVRAKYGEGVVFGAKEALSAGLIDRIATMDETIGRLVGRKSLAGMRAIGMVSDDLIRASSVEVPTDQVMALAEDEMRENDMAARLRLL